jgi:hypothetical protein
MRKSKLEQLESYKNLYKKYKSKYLNKKKLLQKGGDFTHEHLKSYSTKLNEFKEKILAIVDRKHNINFIKFCKNELQNDNDLTEQEKKDFHAICEDFDKNPDKIDNIYASLLNFIHKYNYTNLKEFAEIDIKEKKIKRYEELVREFDSKNYHRGGFLKYHNLNELPDNMNIFKSSINNHYKPINSFKYNVQSKLKEYFKDNKFISSFI